MTGAIAPYRKQRFGFVEVAVIVRPAKKAPFWRIYLGLGGLAGRDLSDKRMDGWVPAGEPVSQSTSISNLEYLQRMSLASSPNILTSI